MFGNLNTFTPSAPISASWLIFYVYFCLVICGSQLGIAPTNIDI